MMSKTLFVLFLVLIPIIILGSATEFYPTVNPPHSISYANPGRAWRLNEVLVDNYDGFNWSYGGRTVYVYNPVFTTRVDTLKVYSQFALMMRKDYTYDISGQFCIMETSYNYLDGVATPNVRYIIEYDSQSRLKKFSREVYESGTWILAYRDTYYYNANAISHAITYIPPWDPDPAFWEKTTITNDASGRPIICVKQSSADSLNWSYEEQTEINYNAADTHTGNDFIAAMRYNFHSFNSHPAFLCEDAAMVSEATILIHDSGWLNQSRYEYTYDANNKRTETTRKTWISDWVNQMRYQYSYDANGNTYQEMVSNWSQGNWSNIFRNTSNWEQVTAAEDDVLPVPDILGVTASPNPFNSQIRIAYTGKSALPAEINIYNLKGQLVNRFSVKANSSYVWNGADRFNRQVPEGIYFLKAVTGEQSKLIRVVRIKH